MSQPHVTWCPPQPQSHSSPRLQPHAFYDRERFLTNSGLSYSDMARLSIGRVADLRGGRRLPVPAWTISDEQFRTVIVKILENRFLIPISARTGTLKERLDRCRAAAKRLAATKRLCMDAHISQFRALSNNQLDELSPSNYERLFLEALRGKGVTARLNALEKNIRILDGQVYTEERAPELLTAVLFHYFRLGHNSPTIAETLGLTPWQVRQIIFRARKVADREEGRAKRRKRRTQWLNLAKVAEIRRLAANRVPWEAIAAQFCIKRSSVQNVVNGDTWRGRRRPRE